MHKGIHAAGNKRRIVNSIHAGAEIALLNIIPGPTYNERRNEPSLKRWRFNAYSDKSLISLLRILQDWSSSHDSHEKFSKKAWTQKRMMCVKWIWDFPVGS